MFNQHLGNILAGYAEAIPVLGLTVAVAGFGAYLAFRSRSLRLWWLPAILAPGLVMPLMFGLMARPDWTFFPRYAFFTVPAVALLVAIAVDRVPDIPAAALLALILVPSGQATLVGFSGHREPDYARLVSAIDSLQRGDAQVVFEYSRALDRWRPSYIPGENRYGDPDLPKISVDRLAWNEIQLAPNRPLVIVGTGDAPSGWSTVDLVDGFRVMLPPHDTDWTSSGQAEVLWEACEARGFRTGAYLCATAVRLWHGDGNVGEAESRYLALMAGVDSEIARQRLTDALADLGLPTYPS